MKALVYGLLSILILQPSLFAQVSGGEINIVHGEHHIFTINTPIGWLNDRQMAQQLGLTNFFYSKSDFKKEQKSYMYAHGYDKSSLNKNLEEFVEADLARFKNKYPKLIYDSITTGSTGPIVHSLMLRFENLNDRYKEEVFYLETKDAIIVMSFAAFTEQQYSSYSSVFGQFISSFIYRGNNPKPVLEWVENKK